MLGELSQQHVIPVLKANAYGHGIYQVAKALDTMDVPYFATHDYFEALKIREVSKKPVLIMGTIKPENFAHMYYDNFTFVVHDAASIEALGRTGKRLKLHLECNTGMNRYGVEPAKAVDLARLILKFKNLQLEGVMSHMADAIGDDPNTVNKAVSLFDACVEAIHLAGADPLFMHVTQSAGALRAHSKYANAIRLGIATYGINPLGTQHAIRHVFQGLRPALRLVSTITKINELKAGERANYRYQYIAPKDTRIGVLPLGYYEGLRRELKEVGVVKVGEVFVPLAGRVNMNHTLIDLGGANAKVGTEVVVYSDDPREPNSIQHIADKHGILSYGLLVGINSNIRRTLLP
jgi:alanine racemase